MPGLRHIRISTRILLLIFSVVVFIVCLSLWLGSVLQSNLLQEKRSGVGSVLDTASELLAHFDKHVRVGHVSLKEAQRQAADVVSTIRYLGDNYLLILDLDYLMVMHPTAPAQVGKQVEGFEDGNGKLLAWLLIRTIIPPLNYTDSALSRATREQTNLTMLLPLDGNDEQTQVAHSSNLLVDATQQIIHSMELPGADLDNQRFLSAAHRLQHEPMSGIAVTTLPVKVSSVSSNGSA